MTWYFEQRYYSSKKDLVESCISEINEVVIVDFEDKKLDFFSALGYPVSIYDEKVVWIAARLDDVGWRATLLDLSLEDKQKILPPEKYNKRKSK